MNKSANSVYVTFNGIGVAASYILMGGSLWLSDMDLSMKAFWAMGIFMLTLSLVNLVKYRMDERSDLDKLTILETAKNEKIIEDFIKED